MGGTSTSFSHQKENFRSTRQVETHKGVRSVSKCVININTTNAGNSNRRNYKKPQITGDIFSTSLITKYFTCSDIPFIIITFFVPLNSVFMYVYAHFFDYFRRLTIIFASKTSLLFQ
ncbi:Hypothetical predicted protein [Octopus vulgaris]|uniref:Uncharacterized protein n=1 Tax=Octopus vulgaris TaxID=6645 RepID=A0AA36F018_OCTVU|nr:Hypothetical predicted protein [Octopus vulgaris]